MPIPNSWGKGSAGNPTSALTGIFPGACAVGGKVAAGETLGLASTATDSGVFIPFSNLTGVDNAIGSEIGTATTTTVSLADKPAGGARFILGMLEAAYAAQQNHASADRLANCVVTRTSLSVVDEDTLQKTFTVKFKLNHIAQEVEDE